MNDIHLRIVESKDACGMLDWMHDSKVNQFFRFDADSMTVQKAEDFVKSAKEAADAKESYHFAIADENDEYLGTISLKNIDWDAKTAEYAIVLRLVAQGKGVGTVATKLILEYAFQELELNRVYLNVLEDNENAIRLYEKCGFKYEGEFKNHLCIRGQIKSLKWYAIMRDEYEKRK